MAAALPGLAMQAIAELWGQQPELAAGIYAAGAVFAAVPQYVPTFEQAKLWCQKPRPSVRPVTESTPTTNEAVDMVHSKIFRTRKPSIVTVTSPASASLASETIVLVDHQSSIQVLDTFATAGLSYDVSESSVSRAADLTKNSPSQTQLQSSATLETILVETLGAIVEHIASASLLEIPIDLKTTSKNMTVISSRSSPKPTSTDVLATQNNLSNSEDQPAINLVTATASTSNMEASGSTDIVSEVPKSTSLHDRLSRERSFLDASTVSTKSKERTTVDAHGDATSSVSAVVVKKPSRTLLQIIADNLPPRPKLYKKTHMPVDESSALASSSKTVSSQLPTERFLSDTLGSAFRSKHHGPTLIPSAEPLVMKPPHTSPSTPALERITTAEPRPAFEERRMKPCAEQRPVRPFYYKNPISSWDVMLVFVPSILFTICRSLANENLAVHNFLVTMTGYLYVLVVASIICLGSHWFTWRYSFFVMYRHYFESVFCFVMCLTKFFHQWQQALATFLGKQQTDHLIAGRAMHTVLIVTTICFLSIIGGIIRRKLQREEPQDATVNPQRQAPLLHACIGPIICSAVIWSSVYVQDFVLSFATAGLVYGLHFYYGQLLNLASRALHGIYISLMVARPWIPIYAVTAVMVYLVNHPDQLLECFVRTDDAVLPPSSHVANLFKYVAFPIIIFWTHDPAVRVLSLFQARLQVVRSWIRNKCTIVVNGQVFGPWHQRTVRGYFSWVLATIAQGADNVPGRFLLEWLGPVLEGIAMLIIALALMYVFIPLYQILFKKICYTVLPGTRRTWEKIGHKDEVTKLWTAGNDSSFSTWTTQRQIHTVSDVLASAWTVVSSVFTIPSMKTDNFRSTTIERAVAYIGMSCGENWCPGPAWSWLPRATAIILATIFCTTGWIIAARAYPEHKIRSCLSFASSFMVTYILGALEVLQCTQDYFIILGTIFAILLFQTYRRQPSPDIQGPPGEAPPSPPDELVTDAPVPVDKPLPLLWWQSLRDWCRDTREAREGAMKEAQAAREKATGEAIVALEQEGADNPAEVDRLSRNQPSIATNPEYLKKMKGMQSEPDTMQLPSDDEIPTAETNWDVTPPFRPLDTERQYQAVPGREEAAGVPPAAATEGLIEPSIALVSQVPAAPTVASEFTPAMPALPTKPSPPTSVSPTRSTFPAGSTLLSAATSLSSLFVPAPETTPTAAQEASATAVDFLAKTDVPDTFPLNDNQGNDDDDFNSDDSGGGFGEDTFTQGTSAPTQPIVLPNDDIAAEIEKLREQMRLDGEQKSVTTPTQGTPEGAVPVGNNGDDSEEPRMEAKQRNETTSSQVASSGTPPPRDDGDDSEYDDGGDTPMSDAPKYSADISQQNSSLPESKNDDVTMGGMDDVDEEPTPVTTDAVVLGTQPPTADEPALHSPSTGPVPSSGSNLSVQPARTASRFLPSARFSAIPGLGSFAQQELDTQFALPAVYNRPVARPTDPRYEDLQEKWRNRLLGSEGTLTRMRRNREALASRTQGDGSGGDAPPGPGGPSGGSGHSGGNSGGDGVGNVEGGDGSDRPAPFDPSRGSGAPNSHEPSPTVDSSTPVTDVDEGPSSGEGLHHETDLNSHNKDGGPPGNNKADSRYPKNDDSDDDDSDDSSDDNYFDPPVRRQASTIGGVTSTVPSTGASGITAATIRANLMNFDEDSEMTDLPTTNQAGVGDIDPNMTAPASLNEEEALRLLQAAQYAWEQQNGISTTPPAFEGAQDFATGDSWNNTFANADYRSTLEHGSQPQQDDDDTSPEELARIEAAKKDKQMQRDARKDLGLSLDGYEQLSDFESQSSDENYDGADRHENLMAGVSGINLGDSYANDYGQAQGVDQDFKTTPDNATGDDQSTTSTKYEDENVSWTDIRPRTRLVQLWEDDQIVPNPDYPEHRSAGMKSLEETFGQPCQIFREVDMVAYDTFGEDHENFIYAQDGVDWFDPAAEGAEPRDDPETESDEGGDEGSEAADESNEFLKERIDALKSGFNTNLLVEYDDDSDLLDPPSADELDKIGAEIANTQKEGSDADVDSENQGPGTGPSTCDTDMTESHVMTPDGTKEEAGRFDCTTDKEITDFMDSINRPEKQEGGTFLTPDPWNGRNRDGMTSSVSPTLATSPLPSPAPGPGQKKRFTGPVSFDTGENVVQPIGQPASSVSKRLSDTMANSNLKSRRPATSQNMTISTSAALENTSLVSAISSSLPSGIKGALKTPLVSGFNSASPSYHYRPPVTPVTYGSIKASSLPFDPSKPRPYVPPGVASSSLNSLSSINPFSPISGTNTPVAPYFQRGDVVSPIRRPGYQPLNLPKALLPTPDDPPRRRLAYSPMYVSTEMTAPPINTPVYDLSQPTVGMASGSSSVGTPPHDHAEPRAPTMSDSQKSSEGFQESAPQSPAPSIAATAYSDKMMDMDN